MGLFNSKLGYVQPTQKTQIDKSSNSRLGVVYDVILDKENQNISKVISDNIEYDDITLIGAIIFRYSNDLTNDSSFLSIAYPFDKNFVNLPLVNETIEIYNGLNSSKFYRRIGSDVSPNLNNNPNLIKSTYIKNGNGDTKIENYKSVSNTGIQKNNYTDSTEGLIGNYFKLTRGIHKLKYYEGDSLIQSRFGQSIRFSAYNNPNNTFSPTIIIRNGENSISSTNNNVDDITEEDINRDGSTIVLSSNQYQLNFQPGTVDDGGSSDFQTKPDSFTSYPSKLIGDQILINSGRLIFSAKTGEMIFYSKKNYGFISDGGLSIDNKLGIDISVGDNINVVTNDRDVAIHSGNGSIFLGSTELQPLVKGQTLVNLLGELIDEIGNMVFLTPSGPSASGPTNVNKFGSIKSKLNTALSKLNQTS